jgi:ubiquinone/menaquinone biosynthesis C-methylase UbiE
MNDPIVARNIANYASAWSIAEYGGEVGLRPVEAELVEEFFPPVPAHVLDLGCGAGRTTIALAQRGYDVLGIDLSAALLDVARQRYPSLSFAEMDATALQLASASLDAALFSYNGIDCIYPREARRLCFREVHRVLRPGGLFVLSSHNAIGATFSGGYFYLQGYLNAARFAAAQLTNRLAAEWYLRYDDPGGTQYLFSAPPDRTIADAEAAGFTLVALRGSRGESDPHRLRMHEKHVHFVLRKVG